MNITQLKINGNIIEGLEDSSVKLSITNVSPVTITGDSVAFSATLKAPRTPANDATFKGMNKALHNCAFYEAELTIRTVPFSYYGWVSNKPVKFYARVSATPEEYSINLIEDTEKWADVSRPISKPLKSASVTDEGRSRRAIDVANLIRDYFNFPQYDLPLCRPVYNTGVPPANSDILRPSIILNTGSLSWQVNVANGNVQLIPKESAKGRGGYIYAPVAELVMDDAMKYLMSDEFPNRAGGGPAGFLIRSGEDTQFYMIVQYLGADPNITKPTITIRGNSSHLGRAMSYYGSITPNIWIYNTPTNFDLTVYPKVDKYLELVATIGGVERNDYFKFPDGYAPNEVFQTGGGQCIYDASMQPQFNTVQGALIDFPYHDAKKIIDDFCTAFHWRRIYRDGVLAIEPIIHPSIRDNKSDKADYIIDWSDKFAGLIGVEIPDEFADQYICSLSDRVFSYAGGAGTLQPVKEAFKSGIPYYPSSGMFQYPRVAFADVFNGGTPSTRYTTSLRNTYYRYINRHFDLFSPRVQVKIKANLSFSDIQNLRLDRAYYFSQLGGYFYLKALNEYDVSKGDCKLTLYKLKIA